MPKEVLSLINRMVEWMKRSVEKPRFSVFKVLFNELQKPSIIIQKIYKKKTHTVFPYRLIMGSVFFFLNNCMFHTLNIKIKSEIWTSISPISSLDFGSLQTNIDNNVL